MNRTFIQYLLLLALLPVVAACTTFSPTIAQDVEEKAEYGYVYGRFTLKHTPPSSIHLRIGLVLDEKKGGTSYTIPLEQSGTPSAIAVKPGTYALKKVVFAYWTFESAGQRPIKEDWLTQSFVVAPGKAYYLGDFTGHTDTSAFQAASWRLASVRNDFQKTTMEFKNKYPGLIRLDYVRAIEY